jgi:hypothetical protein
MSTRLVAIVVLLLSLRAHADGLPQFGVGQDGRAGVRGGQQGVQDHGLVAAADQGRDDVRADEPRASGDEYSHGADATQSRGRNARSTPGRKTSVTGWGTPAPVDTERAESVGRTRSTRPVLARTHVRGLR